MNAINTGQPHPIFLRIQGCVMDVLQSENVEDMLIDETINNVPLSSISQQQNETVTELNVLNSRKRQREVKQTTEETSSEKKGKQDRETSKYEFITLLMFSICMSC